MEKLFGFAFDQECVSVYVWACLFSVDWGNGNQNQMSDFRVEEKYAVYRPLSTSDPLSTQGFLLSEVVDGCSVFPYVVFS